MPRVYSPEETARHAEMFAARLRKRFDHFHKKYRREGIDCFRLYDWDIPEIRAVADWYPGHLVVGEYERLQTGPDWLPTVAAAAGRALQLPPENVHLRSRRTGTGEGPRYRALGRRDARFAVNERDLKLFVNLEDFLDTGLFSDHRDTRRRIRPEMEGRRFLNLFCYTGAFTVNAAKGGAATTTSVDRNETYLNWLADNLELNGLADDRHRLVDDDVGHFLLQEKRTARRYDVVVCDPPSFFQDRTEGISFDVARDHPELLARVHDVMAPGAVLYFSTNHQRFEPAFEGLPFGSVEEITPATIPEDYRNKKVHRCWRFLQ